jgi:hypothetical protein
VYTSAGIRESLVFPLTNVILREETSEEDFVIGTAEEMASVQKQHPDFEMVQR